jgi:hypothetical protein
MYLFPTLGTFKVKGKNFTSNGYMAPIIKFKMNKLFLYPYGKDHVFFNSTGADIYISLPNMKINVF